MTAFARPPAGTSSEAWWAKATPYLTTQAAADYHGTNPTRVPYTRVTGPATVVPLDAADSTMIAVRVPTDAGPYLVEVLPGPAGLRVARATPEDGP